MIFDLIIKEPLSELKDFECEIYEPDSMIEIFSIMENAIDLTEKIDFYFECFSEQFNLTVFGDLSVFLEQLVSLYKLSLSDYHEYLLDFYEVGTNLKLLFKNDNGNIFITNIDNYNKSDVIQASDFEESIIKFVNKVRDIIGEITPSLNEIEALKDWYSIFKEKYDRNTK